MKVFKRFRGRQLIVTVGFVLACATATAKEKPPIQYQIPVPAAPDFTAFDWLQGTWTGKTVAPSPPGELKVSVSPELQKRFLVLHGELSLEATAGTPATHETWIGILSAEGGNFILRIFSSTGFVTRYHLLIEGAEIHLNPEGGESVPAGWLFRRDWSRTGTDQWTETVEAAPPGKTFFNYYIAQFSRVAPPAKPKPAQ